MSFDLKVTVEGMPQMIQALRMTNEVTRAQSIAAIRRTTRAVLTRAISRAPKRSGELVSTLRDEYSKDELSGYVKAGYGKLIRRSRAKSAEGLARHKARREQLRLQLALANTSKQALSVIELGVYSPVVERGDPRRHKPAEPYLIPSLYAEQPALITELQNAVRRAASVGGLNP